MRAKERTETVEAMILWRRKGPSYSVIPYVTRRGVLDEGILPQRQLQTLKGAGYLQPFSQVHVTVSATGDYKKLYQVDGVRSLVGAQDSVESIAYVSVLGELVFHLFQKGAGHERLFYLLSGFTARMQGKSIPMGVVLLGWQLLCLAGFIPAPNDYEQHRLTFVQELAAATGQSVLSSVGEAIGQVLCYDWRKSQTVSFTPRQWMHLERLLFAFAESQVERPLRSIQFLRDMECSVLTKHSPIGIID